MRREAYDQRFAVGPAWIATLPQRTVNAYARAAQATADHAVPANKATEDSIKHVPLLKTACLSPCEPASHRTSSAK